MGLLDLVKKSCSGVKTSLKYVGAKAKYRFANYYQVSIYQQEARGMFLREFFLEISQWICQRYRTRIICLLILQVPTVKNCMEFQFRSVNIL